MLAQEKIAPAQETVILDIQAELSRLNLQAANDSRVASQAIAGSATSVNNMGKAIADLLRAHAETY